MEDEFRRILQLAKKGEKIPSTSNVAVNSGYSTGQIALDNDLIDKVIVVKKKGNLFKILKYVIIVGVIATIGGIIYMCVKRVKNSEETIVPYTPIKLEDLSGDECDEDDNTHTTAIHDDEEDDSYKYDEQFTLLEDLPLDDDDHE